MAQQLVCEHPSGCLQCIPIGLVGLLALETEAVGETLSERNWIFTADHKCEFYSKGSKNCADA